VPGTRVNLRRAFTACLGTLALSLAWVFGPLAFAHFAADTDERVVALTFDDGPYLPYTEALLDVLDAEAVRATFFVTGANLAAHPELGRRMLRAGHALANRSWDDAVLAFTAPVGIYARIERTDALLREIGWSGPIDFRAPRGMPGPVTLLELWRTGHRHVLGRGVDDWLRPGHHNGDCLLALGLVCPTQDAAVIEARLLAAAAPGAILVLHDGYDGGPGADRSGSVEAVRRAIPKLRAAGYRFATVPQLLDTD
jgi:peptidoglycan/xylan/chitin deacetylase (PgdA/CDA1 family)